MSTDTEYDDKTLLTPAGSEEVETNEVLATQTQAFELLGDPKANIISSYANKKLASLIQLMNVAGTITSEEFFTQTYPSTEAFLRRLPLTRDRFSNLLRAYLDYYVPGEVYPPNFLSIDSFTTFLEIKLGDMMYLSGVINQIISGLNYTFDFHGDTASLISKYNTWVTNRREDFPKSKFQPEIIDKDDVDRIIGDMRHYGLISFGLTVATIDDFKKGVGNTMNMLYEAVNEFTAIYKGIKNPDPDLQLDLIDIFLNIAPTYAFQALNDISTYLFTKITSNSTILSALRHEMKLTDFLPLINLTEAFYANRHKVPADQLDAKLKAREVQLHSALVKTGKFLESSTLYKNRTALQPYTSIPLYEIIQTTSYLETGNMQLLTDENSKLAELLDTLLHPENALRIAVIFNELENNAWKAIIDRKYVDASWSAPSNAIVKVVDIELDTNGRGPILVLKVFDQGIGINPKGETRWRDPLQLSSGSGLGLLASLNTDHALIDIRNNPEEYSHYINQGYRTLSIAKIPMIWESSYKLLES